MLAGVISGILTFAAVLLALWSLKRIGKDAYAMILSERFERRRAGNNQSQPQSSQSGDTNETQSNNRLKEGKTTSGN